MMKLKIFLHADMVQDLTLLINKQYVIGRNSECDIVLDDPKVSRQHAKIYFDGSQWNMELISRFGKLKKEGFDVESTKIADEDEFSISTFKLIFIKSEDSQYGSSSQSQVSYGVSDISESPQFSMSVADHQMPESEDIDDSNSDVDDFSEFRDEASSAIQLEDTNAGFGDSTAVNVSLGEPFLRIIYKTGKEDMYRLEGNHWVIGRSEKIDVRVKDSRCSRKHIVVTKEGTEFFLKDLGSSNGTSVNSSKIGREQKIGIQSGDEILIGDSILRFELRDPNFEAKINQLPVVIHNSPIKFGNQDIIPIGSPGAMVPQSPGGALGQIIPQRGMGKNTKNKKVIYIAVALIAVAGVFGLSDGKPKNETKNSKEMASKKSPWDALSFEQQEFIKARYNTAYNFYIQGSYELALTEVEKIHSILPSGYVDKELPDKNSKQLEKFSRTGIERERELNRIAVQKKQQRLFQEKLDEQMQRCINLGAQASSAQLQECFSFILENQPNNPTALQMISAAKEREQNRLLMAQQRATQQRLAGKGSALYNQAVAIERSGDFLDAIEAYQVHIRSNFPDPRNLKSKSRQAIAQLKSGIKTKTSSLYNEAITAYENDNHRKALELLQKLLEIDPSNIEAEDKSREISSKLYIKLKSIYEDSILFENHGEITEAKNAWLKIKDQDIKGGRYYKKVVIKLRKYGIE
ncbi:MAG: FHA domain-containing protein [Bdellovibrionales bacterium]